LVNYFILFLKKHKFSFATFSDFFAPFLEIKKKREFEVEKKKKKKNLTYLLCL
jgi:hypothetical protein